MQRPFWFYTMALTDIASRKVRAKSPLVREYQRLRYELSFLDASSTCQKLSEQTSILNAYNSRLDAIERRLDANIRLLDFLCDIPAVLPDIPVKVMPPLTGNRQTILKHPAKYLPKYCAENRHLAWVKRRIRNVQGVWINRAFPYRLRRLHLCKSCWKSYRVQYVCNERNKVNAVKIQLLTECKHRSRLSAFAWVEPETRKELIWSNDRPLVDKNSKKKVSSREQIFISHSDDENFFLEHLGFKIRAKEERTNERTAHRQYFTTIEYRDLVANLELPTRSYQPEMSDSEYLQRSTVQPLPSVAQISIPVRPHSRKIKESTQFDSLDKARLAQRRLDALRDLQASAQMNKLLEQLSNHLNNRRNK